MEATKKIFSLKLQLSSACVKCSVLTTPNMYSGAKTCFLGLVVDNYRHILVNLGRG